MLEITHYKKSIYVFVMCYIHKIYQKNLKLISNSKLKVKHTFNGAFSCYLILIVM